MIGFEISIARLTPARAGPARRRREELQTDEITLKLATGETLKLARDEARVLAQRLWDIGSHPGAALIAVKISEVVSASALLREPIEVSEREYGALSQVLAEP